MHIYHGLRYAQNVHRALEHALCVARFLVAARGMSITLYYISSHQGSTGEEPDDEDFEEYQVPFNNFILQLQGRLPTTVRISEQRWTRVTLGPCPVNQLNTTAVPESAEYYWKNAAC